MRVISRSKLLSFWVHHADAEESLKTWFREAEQATWKTSSDIKARYSTASFLGDNRVVFNIKGNDYRLIVKVHYANDSFGGVVYIRFIDTHAEYDKINAEKI